MLNQLNIKALDSRMLKVPSGRELMLTFNSIPILNGIKLQIMESLTHMLSIEKLMPVMVSNSEDGLIHSAGLTPVPMMIKFLFNMMNLASILQLITDLVMKKSSISFNSDMMFPRDQLKPITEKMSQVLYTENPGTSLELAPINLNLVDGPTHSHGLMKEKVMTESSEEKSQMYEAFQKQLTNDCKIFSF